MKNWFEIKYSLRVLLKSPGHTALCVAIVAISLCVGIIVLTMVYNMMYKPLAYQNADRWVHLTRISKPDGVSAGGDSLSSFYYQYLKDNSTVFENLGAFRAFSESRVIYDDSATRVSSAEITPHIFQATGTRALLGRSLLASDSRSDNQVAVISFSLWQNYFSSDPDIVGKTVSFDEATLTVVGVMPKNTAFGMKHDVWIANQSWVAHSPDASNVRDVTPVGILKPGVSLAFAQAELSQLTQQLKQLYPDYFPDDFSVLLSPFKQFLLEDSAPIFLAIAILSCVIVALGAANIANLLIARAIERKQEFAVRSCVGSSLFDLVRQSLVETLIVCAAGTLVALPVTVMGMAGINYYLENVGKTRGWSVPTESMLHLDGASIAIALAVLAAIWLVCGMGPALRLRKLKFSEVLSSGKGSSDQSTFRSAKLLVAGQVITCFFLLIVSGSLLLSILHIVHADYGLQLDNRYAIDLEFPGEYYFDPSRRIAAIKNIEQNLASSELILNAAAVAGLPHTAAVVPYAIGDRELTANGLYPNVQLAVYAPEAFGLLGVDILEGRNFDATDAGEDFAVTVVDRNFARTMWPNQSPLGKRVQVPAGSGNWLRVVGVSEPVLPGMRYANLNRENTIYIPIEDLYSNELQLVVQTKTVTTQAEVFAQVRDTVANIDRRIAVYNARTLSDHLRGPTYGLQLLANVFVIFGIVAVVLAIVGVFAVISRIVQQQSGIIGIRRAIGSSKTKVLMLYLKQGGIFLLVGTIIGGGGALLMTNTLSRFFNDLPQSTPVVTLLVIFGLGAMIGIASILPTKKVLMLEPGDALRQM